MSHALIATQHSCGYIYIYIYGFNSNKEKRPKRERVRVTVWSGFQWVHSLENWRRYVVHGLCKQTTNTHALHTAEWSVNKGKIADWIMLLPGQNISG